MFVALSVALVIGALPAGAQAQHAHSDWSRVRALANGARIIIMAKGSWTATRHFVSADDDQLVVADDLGQIARIVRTDIGEIRKERSKLREAVLLPIALLVTFAGAWAAGTLTDRMDGAVLGAIGACVTSVAIIDNRYRRAAVIYRAP